MAFRTDQNAATESTWDDNLQRAALSDVGMRRLNNQDSFCAMPARDRQLWEQRGHFFMVADGMGAHAAGELASKLAVEGVSHRYFKYTDLSPPEALQRAVVETNSEIHRRGQANADFFNMGTTASALLLLPQGALAAHIGDSRVYRLRNGRVQQLTRDHSLVWELREQAAANSELSIPKNVITRSLGPNPVVQVDVEGPLPLDAGDTFLLCTDGLTGRVTDEELGAILELLPPAEAAQMLVDMANLRGGPDNITVIVAKAAGKEQDGDDMRPLTIGRRQGPATVQPAIWVCFGVCLLGALVLSITGNWLPALLSACGAGLSLLLAQFSRRRHRGSGVSLRDGRRLGQGPYTDTPCATGPQVSATVGGMARELRSSGQQNAGLDWSEFNSAADAGEECERSGKHAEAVRHYARAFRSLMQRVRDHQNKRANDTTLDI
jgi:protein phosphatase